MRETRGQQSSDCEQTAEVKRRWPYGDERMYDQGKSVLPLSLCCGPNMGEESQKGSEVDWSMVGMIDVLNMLPYLRYGLSISFGH